VRILIRRVIQVCILLHHAGIILYHHAGTHITPSCRCAFHSVMRFTSSWKYAHCTPSWMHSFHSIMHISLLLHHSDLQLTSSCMINDECRLFHFSNVHLSFETITSCFVRFIPGLECGSNIAFSEVYCTVPA